MSNNALPTLNVSDYRGVPSVSNLSGSSNNAISTPNASDNRGVTTVSAIQKASQKKMSFSGAVKSSAFPKKDQAIIFPVIEGLQVRDYVLATGDIVDPKDILFAFRMSNGRMCLYFSSKDIVNDFIENHGGVNINDTYVPARKLILPAQRIILSNVQPCIPHEVIEEVLRGRGLKLVSPISFVGAGINPDPFRHIFSSRRQVFVATDQAHDIPNSVCITFEEEDYRIFLSDDKLRCFRCKAEGHISSNCNAPVVDIHIPDIFNKRPAPPTEGTTEGTSLEVQESCSDSTDADAIQDTMEAESIQDSHEDSDQPPSTSNVSSTPLTENEASFQQVVHPRPASKKLKLDTDTDPDRKQPESYKEIEEIWQQSSRSMSYIDFTQFFNHVKGSSRPLDVARTYTDNLDGLLALLKLVQLKLSERTPKERCKRLIVSLKKALVKEGVEISSPWQSRSSSVTSMTRSVSQESVQSNTSY